MTHLKVIKLEIATLIAAHPYVSFFRTSETRASWKQQIALDICDRQSSGIHVISIQLRWLLALCLVTFCGIQ
jgi:hypothetical protein